MTVPYIYTERARTSCLFSLLHFVSCTSDRRVRESRKRRQKMEMITLEEGMKILEEGILKARNILLGLSPRELFSGEDFMKFYNCVFCMCTRRPPNDFSEELYERFGSALRESIVSMVLPSLYDKHDASLLVELLQMWGKYKVMAKVLSGFFMYLDNYYIGRKDLDSLNDVSIQCFCDVVCDNLFDRFRDAAISLINQERNGMQVDRDLLKNVLAFFVQMDEGRKIYCATNFYENFELVMLEETAICYSRLASELLICNSYTDYIRKAEWWLIQEKGRASQYLQQATLEKLIQVVTWQLSGQIESKLIEKQNTEGHDSAMYQELLSKYASISLREGSSALPL